MITLLLLHPQKKVPVQHWTFENEPVIRIGRSTDNHVVLYSAVVSRHHVELRQQGTRWEIVSLGTNGTYVEGQRITQAPAQDGVIIRLARSGPNIQIRLGSKALKDIQAAADEEKTVGQMNQSLQPPIAKTSADTSISQPLQDQHAPETRTPPRQHRIPVPDHLRLPEEAAVPSADSAQPPASSQVVADQALMSPSAAMFSELIEDEMVTAADDAAIAAARHRPLSPKQLDEGPPLSAQRLSGCPHIRQGTVFCLDCGRPLHPMMAIANYQIVGRLGQGEVGVTYWAWQDGHNVVLKTLNPEWVDHPGALMAFQQEVELLHRLHHAQIPRFIDYFQVRGQPYLVMELIRGLTLARQVQQHGPVSEAQAAVWMVELCQALSYLHGQEPMVLHRSLNPYSLVVRSQPASPSMTVVNFDVVELDTLGVDRPGDQSVYVAPEAAGDLDPSSDLYSIGPLLIYLLTGHQPDMYYGNRDQGKRLYPEYVTGLSGGMTHIIRTLTHPDPLVRYDSAESLAADLRSVAAAG